MKSIKENSTEILFGILVTLIIIIGILNYQTTSQYFKHFNNFSKSNSKYKTLDKLISISKDSIITITNPEIYQIQKDVVELKEENVFIKNLIEEKHNDWLAYLANFWAIIGLILGSIAVIFSYKEKIKKEVNKQVSVEVNKQVKSKVDLLKQQLEEIEKHKKYKSKSKIIVVNKKGTKFPTHFKAVLKLFNIDVGIPENRVDVGDISEIIKDKNLIERLKQADLVIVENKEPSGIWNTTTYSNDYVDLANSICETTPILYYGDGRYPIDKVNSDKQHFVAYTNASSQLYGNMLNVLKYKFELENA